MREAADLLLAATDARRVELGKRWKQVYTEAGLTHQTLNRWRNGLAVDPLTERAFERALQWGPGARESIAARRQPQPLEWTPEETPSRQGDADEEAGPTLSQELALASRILLATVREIGLSPDEAEEAWRRARLEIERTHKAKTRDEGGQNPQGRSAI